MVAQGFADLHKPVAFPVAQHIQQLKSAGDFGQVFAFYDGGGPIVVTDTSRFGADPDRQTGVCVSRLPAYDVEIRAAA